MGLNIKNPSTEALIRELALRDGISLTEAVERGVRSLLGDPEELRRQEREQRLKAIRAIVDHVATLPVLDPRPLQEIMDDMYDEHGLPV